MCKILYQKKYAMFVGQIIARKRELVKTTYLMAMDLSGQRWMILTLSVRRILSRFSLHRRHCESMLRHRFNWGSIIAGKLFQLATANEKPPDSLV